MNLIVRLNKMNLMKKLTKWHQTKLGLLAFSVVELAIAYGFATLAIDRGNFLWYTLALVLLFGCIQNFAKLIGRVSHGHQR
jgi:hypothetical protein